MKCTPLARKTPLKAKAPMKRSSKPKMTPIRASARGQGCLVRSEVCNGNPETVVLAHLNGGGMGCKNPDWQAAYACSDCHEWLDGGYARYGWSADERNLLHYQSVLRTQQILVEQGLIQVKGAA